MRADRHALQSNTPLTVIETRARWRRASSTASPVAQAARNNQNHLVAVPRSRQDRNWQGSAHPRNDLSASGQEIGPLQAALGIELFFRWVSRR